MIKSSFRHLIALALFFAMLLSCFGCAFADEDNGGFTLRNGIMFGDTIDDILAKETTLKSAYSYSDSYDDNYATFWGTICGYERSKCVFSFDENNMLYDMLYIFEMYDTQNSWGIKDSSESDAIYETIYNGLKRKYGEPLYSNGNNPCHIIVGSAFDSFAPTIDSIDNREFENYFEWIVDANSYYVKIDFTLGISYLSSRDDARYMVLLSYHKFTDSDYEARIAEKLHEQEIIDRDL